MNNSVSKKQYIVNDFVIEAATVNGSGSQTSNLILTKAIFRMGIPVGPKNIFPSNIAGLPTWYIMRVNGDGYLSRKGTTDILIGLNAMTFAQDVPRVRAGGLIVHDAGYPITGNAKREDVIYFPVPFDALATTFVTDTKLRKPLTNMIYVGILAEILHIEQEFIEAALSHQFKGKQKAVAPNLQAIEVGRKYARENFKQQVPYRVERMNKTQNKVLVEGNMAAALGALFGGCTVAAWYPITPASSLSEAFEDLVNEFRRDENGKKKYAVIQAEDEIAAVGMALGAGWAGARSMTGTSGPGISLMSEFVGYGYFAEVPTVIFDIQRVGPSTGLPTRTSQGDIAFVANLSHGDTKHIMLIPSSVEECFEFAVLAFDMAERFQTPVFVMSDLDLGMNLWMTDPFKHPEKPFDRGKVLTEEQISKTKFFERYKDVDGDGIPYRTYPGNKHPLAAYFTRGSGHNEAAQYTEEGAAYQRIMERLLKKFETARKATPPSHVDMQPGAKIGIIAYGSTDQAMKEARDVLASKGLKTNYLKLRGYPFQKEPVKDFIKSCSEVFIVEQNRDAQMLQIMKTELGADAMKVKPLLHFDGYPISADFIVHAVSGNIVKDKETVPMVLAGGE